MSALVLLIVSFSTSYCTIIIRPDNNHPFDHVNVYLSPEDLRNMSLPFENNDIQNNSWRINWIYSGTTLGNWPLILTLSDKYHFNPGYSSLSITIDGSCLGSQCDAFWVFSINDQQYVSFVNDFDGAWKKFLNSPSSAGIYIYPQCNTNIISGNASTLIFQTGGFRHKLSGGDNNNWHKLSSSTNGNNFPVTFVVTNNETSNTFSIKFISATFPSGLECVYPSSVSTDVDLKLYVTPDDDGELGLLIHSFTIDDTNIGAGEHDLRIVNGDNYSKGRIEIYHNFQWGTVCDDFGLTCASMGTVVCRQLGFSGCNIVHSWAGRGGTATPTQASYQSPIPPPAQIWMDQVSCVGNEQKLSNCVFNGWGVNDCGHSEDTGIDCTLPTLSPTENPTFITNNPTIPPTKNPTKTPTTNTLSPSNPPTLSPTFAPTSPPSLSPTFSPSFSPSLSPSLSPSSVPSLSPTLSPTLAPTLAPSIAPLPAPSLAPSLSPSIAPSNAPSVVPSLAPSTSPSLAPSVSPSLSPTLAPSSAPSIAPSLSPSVAPSSAPSIVPTSMPTPTCHCAKFKSEMIVSLSMNRNDILWGGESFVSDNCIYLLTVKKNGNLILKSLDSIFIDPFEKDEYGNYIGNINDRCAHKVSGHRWEIGWNTSALVANYSGESVAKLMLEDGSLVVYEEEFKNVPGVEAILLWRSNEIKDVGNDMILRLTDEGCLILNEYEETESANIDTAIWYQCVNVQNDNTDVTSFKTSLYESQSQDDDAFDANANKNKLTSLWWLWLLIILCVLFLMIVIIKQYLDNKKLISNVTITSYQRTDKMKREIEGNKDDDMETTAQIEQWFVETNDTQANVPIMQSGEYMVEMQNIDQETTIMQSGEHMVEMQNTDEPKVMSN